MRPIGGLWGRSPFGPSHEHMLKVLECVESFEPLVDAALRSDRDAVNAAAGRIRGLEIEADDIKKAIRGQFTMSILASVSRSELMALTKAQDDVADECERIAFELSVRPTRFPDFLADNVRAFASETAAAARPLADVSRTLDESGGHLSSDDARRVDALLEKARGNIDRAETLYDGMLRSLFAREREMDALDVIFVMRFAEHTDRLAKKVENVLDVLTRLVTERH